MKVLWIEAISARRLVADGQLQAVKAWLDKKPMRVDRGGKR